MTPWSTWDGSLNQVRWLTELFQMTDWSVQMTHWISLDDSHTYFKWLTESARMTHWIMSDYSVNQYRWLSESAQITHCLNGLIWKLVIYCKTSSHSEMTRIQTHVFLMKCSTCEQLWLWVLWVRWWLLMLCWCLNAAGSALH